MMAAHGDGGQLRPRRPTSRGSWPACERPRRIIMMVQAGCGDRRDDRRRWPRSWSRATSLVDGGNAHFQDTRRREAALREQGLHFVGAGISGGEEGALHGPVDHAGRPARVVRGARPDAGGDRGEGRRRSRAAPTSARTAPATSSRWCTTASSTPTCSSSPRRTTCCGRGWARRPREVGEIFAEWNTGDLESFLIEITADVLRQTDAATGQALVDVVLDQAEPEGHRPLDGPERPRPRRPDHRHRRGDVRPRAVELGAAARGGPRRAARPPPGGGR